MYPITRLRRTRNTQWLRDLVAQINLAPEDMILPLFVIEGSAVRQEIDAMPGVFRYSIDELLKVTRQAYDVGIRAVALFPCVDSALKSDEAMEAYNINSLICRTVKAIKDAGIDIGVICDVALDPYTTHGHDGIVIDREVDNDHTVAALARQALNLVQAGVDMVAPSDMMDGRVGVIRALLDQEGYSNVPILSYAAKYNSSFYGPFRSAVGSSQNSYLCKATYQMDARNRNEAMREIEQDIAEGADIIMIKPAMAYLDVIHAAANRYDVPVFAFQVSGEYAMLKHAALAGVMEWPRSILEALICIKRAGASAIITYSAIEAAQILR
jgi:porphobilinogen synthase